MNKGGFSWKRLSGYSGAKSRLSRQIGVPLTKSGRQRKVGRMVTGGGCALPLAIVSLVIVSLACGATASITPTVQPDATFIPQKSQPVDTVTSTPTSSNDQQIVKQPRANTGVNLRAGPGTNYARVGGATSGQALDIVGRNAAGDWLLLASGAWIAAQLVSDPPAVIPVATVIPTPAAGRSDSAPSATASTCDCSRNSLNCDDFKTPGDAQACYLRCKQITGGDIHALDRDSDGNACEWRD